MRAIQARVDVLREEILASDEQRLRSWRRRVAVIAPGQKDYAGRAEVGARLARLLDAMVEERPVDLSYRSHRSDMPRLVTELGRNASSMRRVNDASERRGKVRLAAG